MGGTGRRGSARQRRDLVQLPRGPAAASWRSLRASRCSHASTPTATTRCPGRSRSPRTPSMCPPSAVCHQADARLRPGHQRPPVTQSPAPLAPSADPGRPPKLFHKPREIVGSRSPLRLPTISLGLWNNFGGDRALETQRAILRRAFDLGITHFDLANNYGPPPGSAEANFGRILDTDFRGYRDELVLSTKAGYDMWPGP